MWKCCDCCEASSDEQHSCAEKNDEEAKIGGEMEEQVTEDEETEDSIEMEEQVTEGDETEDSIEDEEVIYEGPENQLYFDYPINQEIQNNNTFEPGVSVLLANTDDGQGNVCLAKTITSYRFKPRELAIGNCSTTLKDSAIAAEMYIRKNQSALKLTLEVDMHLLVHLFPSEMPKSGFSAGCAIATSMISAIKNIGVPNGYSFLGEIGERGEVLWVGGAEAKIKAAIRHQISNIFLPPSMQNDIERIDEEIKKQINFIYITNYIEAFKILFPENLPEN
uniref:Lon proteolytic domain-containing protein n=1 Tax=Meloidogyne enterolobii TaxID=390850 RepID=A0A6V7XD56_MELEN|nr:unnamed protein product [Meloidogyne enterolobii]